MRHVFFLSIFLIGIAQSYGQSYSFSQPKASYKQLENGISLNTENPWSGFQSFAILMGFDLQFMDSTFTSVSLEATGRVIFDEKHFYYADMFVVAGMQDKGTTHSKSPLSFQISGDLGSQILKIEIHLLAIASGLNQFA